jgi:hypothetical protein
MPIFKYLVYVGSLLSALLLAWSVYLEPPSTNAQATPPPANSPEIFRPTPAPPIVEAEQLAVEGTSEPSASIGRSHHHLAKVAPAKKRQRTHVARTRAHPDRSFAYYPQTPFFFGWR